MSLRVVDISSFFSNTCGGIKTYYRNKARHLPARGVECHFIVPGEKRGEEAFAGGTLHRVAGPAFPGNQHYRMFGDIAGLSRLLRGLRPDVIEVASHYVLPTLVYRAIRTLGGSPPAVLGFLHSDIVGTLVEPFVGHLPWGKLLVSQAWRWVRWRHRRYDGTLVASHTVRRAMQANGIPFVTWVGLGVDTDLFQPIPAIRRSRPRILYSGRLSGDKQIDLLLQTFDRVHEATGAELHVAGDGPLRGRVEAFAWRRENRVFLHGYVDSPAHLARLIAESDVSVIPGSRETFSLSTAESLACGVPVVVPNRGAAAELAVASGAGALFAAGDSSDLGRRIVDTLESTPTRRADMRKQARGYIVDNHGWPTVMARLHEAYATAPC